MSSTLNIPEVFISIPFNGLWPMDSEKNSTSQHVPCTTGCVILAAMLLPSGRYRELLDLKCSNNTQIDLGSEPNLIS
jgi:hypothetical protein